APWQPYERRAPAEYAHLVERIRADVRRSIPPKASVIVVSKGDDQLLALDGRRAYHFPQNDDGVYAGFHPADSAEAISRLEAVRAQGRGDFLLFPQTEMWWLDHYRDFKRHLYDHYRVVAGEQQSCLIFVLSPS